ncbi:LPXTG cell wall anchor domain-containing protein [Promicromonospora citrea]|uniref:LPXTG-motif cell wall-anchored protein n=1 Tax=Promicromonospora citrea TaxID=43677 RepID=A0A8H9GJ67_9MICO|nr:LPXTG cell wall anchor domain-containing protein [Promicromonospora citrea]NNH51570.1 LPXTG cell wall anchor domain-containing protein [Promicromonospora citrea]GGM31522.1 hypothetical protein GCM10010102_28630 [Promicromonospora citrea]
MRKITVWGASALLVAGLVGAPSAAFAAPAPAAPVATTGGATCPKDGKVDVGGEQGSVTVTAPDGYLITGYCVKAGSAKNGAGPETVTVDPPVAEVTISHSSGKAVSHYTLVTVAAGTTPSTEPTPPAEEPAPTAPAEEPAPVDEPTDGPAAEPGTEPVAGPVAEPVADEADGQAPAEEAAAPVPAEGELAATGASTVIGFTLIALALVGGGVTLLVLRRKGVLNG